MVGFREKFGFEVFGAILPVHQFIVDAEISHLAHEVEAAGHDYSELGRRFLRNSEADITPKTIGVVLDAMHRLDDVRIAAITNFNQAVKLAREAGFAVKGEVVDNEAKRIFGLDTIHQPLTGAECRRVGAVLASLAQAYQLAEEKEKFGLRQVLPNNPTLGQVRDQNTLKECVTLWKTRFWEAHELAKKIGLRVYSERNDYLSLNWRIDLSLSSKEKAVDQSINEGLIPSAN